MKRTQLWVLTAALVSAACVMMPAPSDGTDGGTVGQGGGATEPLAPDPGPTEVIGEGVTFDAALLPVPPNPSADDTAACLGEVVPIPELSPEPDRPCSVTEPVVGTTVYRYDSTGRVIYRARPNVGVGEIYTSEDRNGVRLEKVAANGHVSKWDVTQLLGGKPAEADHYTPGADGGLVLAGHSSWLYDDQGRQQYVVSRDNNYDTRFVDRNVYDAKGRLYFIDRTQYWPAAGRVVDHRYTARSYFANGTLAHEIQACDIEGGYPCGVLEKKWEPCGNLAYTGNQTGNGRGSSFTDWNWAADGRSLARHDRWNGVGPYVNSTESYQTDSGTRVKSGTIVITNPPEYAALPPREEHQASYTYDAGRLVDRVLDGKSVFHARFDAAGKVLEVTTNGTSTTSWTYDGCGR